MKINVSNEVIELAEIFEKNGEDLYMVGGYVRDSILGRISTLHNDIDLCAACKPDKVVKMLKNTKFSVDDSNAKFGIVIITGQERYEYATFRRENYNNNGEHNPTGIEFVKNIVDDAKRRDFTINAVYYNILDDQIEDPVLGLEDLQKQVIRCITGAQDSFMQDSERILRMIRLACSLNFEIDEKTLIAASTAYNGVSNLSKDRIRREFDRMLVCDTYYPSAETKYAHAKCMLLIGELNLWQFILPAVQQLQESTIRDEKNEEIYSHIINTLAVCEPSARLSCLLHDVGKLYTKTQKNNFNFSGDWASIIIEKNLGLEGLYYSKKTIEQTKRIVAALDFDKHGLELHGSVRKFIRQNVDIFNEICYLKDAIALENTDFSTKSKVAAKWRKIYKRMLANDTPLTLADLNIKGGDIIENIPKIKVSQISKLLNYLLDYCLSHPAANNKDTLIFVAQKRALKNAEVYLEK